MFIADSFAEKGRYFAACSGEGITRDMRCNAIVVEGKAYPVKEVCVRESFSGVYQAMLELAGPYLPPHSEFSLVQ